MSRMLEEAFGLVFLAPEALYLVPAGAVLLLAVLRPRKGSPRGLPFVAAPLLFGSSGAEPIHRSRSLRSRMRWLPRALQVAALLVLVLALARPARRVILPRIAEGIDVLLCLDLSSSMAESDLGGSASRLDAARAAARSFVAGRSDDRIGLVSFARFPDLRCPPTRDHSALLRFLDELGLVDPDGAEDATGIGAAVALSVRALRESKASSRIVILLTDGEENVATTQSPEEIAPLHAGQLARDLGVKVYAVAVGSGRRDASGSFVPLDTEALERLARRTGGRFWSARDDAGLREAWTAIDALETVPFEAPRVRFEDRWLAFAVFALVMLLASRTLESTWFEVAT